MEITYTMIGTDGQQYGPVSLEQFKSWIGEGRVAMDTKVMRSDTQSWLAARQYPELGLSQAVAGGPPPLSGAALGLISGVSPQAAIDPLMVRRQQLGARWFFWVAGFSAVNILMVQSGRMFLVGLAIGLGSPVLSIVAAAIFAALGFFAVKRHTWGFIVGIVLYGGDALLCLLFQDWLVLAFHGLVLFGLARGLQANLQLNAALKRGRM